jgi:hypothetical protein
MIAKGAALEQRASIPGCIDYTTTVQQDEAAGRTWSPLVTMTKVKSWNGAYNEFIGNHDAKGQYIRFAAEISRSINGSSKRLAFSNRPIRPWQGRQKQATYKYNVLLAGGHVKSFKLLAGQKCLDAGVNVDFLVQDVGGFSVDILNDR